ncbi:Crp/Fnr family transcriptional regulator [Chelatococcus sambhunathii]|uniref:Crp/Fnr family transcriptional regulator n=1 Tax=Chelatococcus sambhunathii TaxID=363953 RepID=A0ABU1DGH2_9HYPH|nr:Crp/Fnr family transcriptional regulator [Chelatococcus sambhunathii]MDR4307201.1 Crp/Fnr family transcriptional regulator [Chelatococcus sambhunathii]
MADMIASVGAHEQKLGAMLVSARRARPGGSALLLEGLTESEIERVNSAGKRRVIYRGATLFRQDSAQDGIFLIESGRIKVFYVARTGREITLAYWHPGNFVGGPDVFSKSTHVWSGVAALNSSVLYLPGDVLREMVSEIPALAINVIRGLSFKGRCYSMLAQMLGTHSPSERLAHLLLQLMELYGVEEPKGTLIAASFTHADIAHMIGVTRQWVTKALKQHAEAGILCTHGASIVVRDPGALKDLSEGQ